MKKSLLFVFPLLFAAVCFSQSVAPSAAIPFDTDVRTGVLPNGLTYYVRKNIKPEHRAELRLVVNTGSIMETDNQQGLAHFCEHMAFNGTTNFGKSELVDFLERTGMRFGADLNAYTSFDETVYMLQIPTDTERIFLKAMQILVDWTQNVSYENSEIDKERGVVVEEWRLGQGANDRMRRKYFPVLFHESRYTDRLPIGKKEIIENAPYDTLRNFYHTWYRPDLMAVIAVGDFDPAKVESLIKQQFSSLVTPQQEKPRIIYPVPDHKDLLVSIATDKEATYTAINLEYKLPVEETKTVADYRTLLTEQLYNTMLGHRYDELIQQPDPPFTYASSDRSSLVRSKDSYSNFAVVNDNGIEKGLQTLVEENERVRRFGFAKTELERAKKELLRNTEQAYNERDKTESRNYTYEYIDHYLRHAPSPGIAWEFKQQQAVLPAITIEDVNALAAKWISGGENTVLIITAPQKEGVTVPSEERLKEIFRTAKEGNITAYNDKVSDKPLLEKKPTPSKVKSENKIADYNITEWTLGNGAKIILKPTDFKNDEVLFSGFSYGGTSLYPDKDFMSAFYAPGIISNSGVGSFDENQLEKYLSDKVVSLGPSISELQQSIGGSAAPKDLETMLQLAYLYFTATRKDSNAFRSTIAQDLAFIQNQHASPEATFRDTIQSVMNAHNYRYQPIDEARLKLVDLNRAYGIYRERFANAGEWTFVFVGNFTPEEIKPLVEMYIGGLPSAGKAETFKDLGISPPSGVIDKRVFKGTEPKSSVNLAFTGPFEYTRAHRNEMVALQKLINIKLRESLRENMGGVYGVGVSPSMKHYPRENYQLSISFSCSPDNVDRLVAAAFIVIDSVKHFGCNSNDLVKVKEGLLKEREINLKQNNFWLSALVQSAANKENILELKDYDRQVNALTSDDFKRLAMQYFKNDNYAKFVLLPQK